MTRNKARGAINWLLLLFRRFYAIVICIKKSLALLILVQKFEKEKQDSRFEKPKNEESNYFEENAKDKFEESSCDSATKPKPNPRVCFLTFHFVN
jgi:hypothetical protein